MEPIWVNTARCHIPDDPAYYENFILRPVILVIKYGKTKFATFGVLICWDPMVSRSQHASHH
jgi:predicted amidohydrolase